MEPCKGPVGARVLGQYEKNWRALHNERADGALQHGCFHDAVCDDQLPEVFPKRYLGSYARTKTRVPFVLEESCNKTVITTNIACESLHPMLRCAAMKRECLNLRANPMKHIRCTFTGLCIRDVPERYRYI